MRRGTVEKDRVRKANETATSGAAAAGATGGGGFGAGGVEDAGVTGRSSMTGAAGATSRAGGRNKSQLGNRDQAQGGTMGLSGKKIARKASVEACLELFKQGKRDMSDAYLKIKEMEGENIQAIIEALEQLSDILCQATYFKKAYELLQGAMKDIQGNPVLFELVARVAFVMESWEKSIIYNKKAVELQ